MTERSVIVRLQAEIGSYVANFGKAKQSTNDLADAQDKAGKSADRVGKAQDGAGKAAAEGAKQQAQAATGAKASLAQLGKAAKENREEWDKVGTTMSAVGTGTVAALGLATKAAMDWESAWAGVMKTVDGTPAQMAELEGGLRDLAKELPATHDEIAGVAEAAGQLGVARDDVVGFTRTMIDLSETTNLSADEAATAIAQISNVMGTMERDGSAGVQRFGAALVALGNDGASTEKEIVMMAQRIAGAAKLVGASESDLLAMANAMASVGIEAQLGGGVMSRVMQRMYGDVMTGGEGLESLASVAGMTAKDFATAFETDPVRAVDSVVKGLNRVKESGGNVIDTMTSLGIKGTEETSVILRLAGAGDLLSESLDLGAEAWEANTALVEEAAKRYETTEAKVQVAWNNIKDAAIDAGAGILPVVAGIAEAAAFLANAFGALPEPVQGALSGILGIAGVGALAAGGLMLIVPRALETAAAFKQIGTDAKGSINFVGKAGKAVGVAAAAYAVFTTAAGAAASAAAADETITSVEKFSNAVQGAGKDTAGAKDAINSLFDGVNKTGSDMFTAVDDLDSALTRIYNRGANDKISDFFGTTFGQNATTGINTAKNALGDLDSSLAGLASSGNYEDAAAGFKIVKEAAEAQDVPIEELVKLFPEYSDALLNAKTASGETQVSQEDLTGAMSGAGDQAAITTEVTEEMAEQLEEVGLSADGTVVSLSKFTEALFASGLAVMSSREASFAWEDKLRDLQLGIEEVLNSQGELGPALNDTATDFNKLTDSGVAANALMQDYAREGLNLASVYSNDVTKSQEDVQWALKSTYDSMVSSAVGLGLSEEAAAALTREMLQIPPDVSIESWMDDEAKRMAEATTGELNAIDGRNVTASITLNEFTNRQVTESVSRLRAGDTSAPPPDPRGPGPWAPLLAVGGRISNIPGFATGGQPGGRIKYPAPADRRKDNVLGLVGGKPIGLQGREWIINGVSSTEYDEELAAINAGTFPKYAGYAGGGTPGHDYAPVAPGYGPSSSDGTTIEMPITINGATDANAVRQAVVGDIKFLMQKNGVRLGD